MCRFIESIKLKEGEIFNLNAHQQRVNDTFLAFFPKTEPINLEQIIPQGDLPTNGFYKIRMVYDQANYNMEIQTYKPRKIKTINFKEVNFEYAFKFENRSNINELKMASNIDELIFMRNGFLLDSTYSNLALFDGFQWLTPSTFLLNGTARQRLIRENKLIVKPIKYTDLHLFKKISFINAMNDLGENVLILKPHHF